jgi:hypothetical protein
VVISTFFKASGVGRTIAAVCLAYRTLQLNRRRGSEPDVANEAIILRARALFGTVVAELHAISGTLSGENSNDARNAEPNFSMKSPTDMSGSPVSTWDMLRSLGFVEDQAILPGSRPALSFDFGNFKLCAASHLNRHFVPVVLLLGVMVTARSLCEVECELPPEVESIEQGKAWVTWCLDDANIFTFCRGNGGWRLITPDPNVSWTGAGLA